jgi:hypothetical protein
MSVVRAWYRWVKAGELPGAFRPTTTIPLWVFLRFNELAHKIEFRNLRDAWEHLCRRGGWTGRGRPPGNRRMPATFAQFCFHYGAARFREAQARLKAVAAAQDALAEARFSTSADLLSRFPDRPKRHRRTRAELSLEGSQL